MSRLRGAQLVAVWGGRERARALQRRGVTPLGLDAGLEGGEGPSLVQGSSDPGLALAFSLSLSRQAQELSAQAHDELTEVLRTAAA